MKRVHKPSLDPQLIAFCQDLRRRRHELHLTIEELAEQANLSPSYISDIECGYRDPSLSTLNAIAGVLNSSLSDLFGPARQHSPAAQEVARLLTDLPESMQVAILEVLHALVRPTRE